MAKYINGKIVVEQGDTLWGIYGPNWKQMSGFVGDATRLQPGTVLPSMNGNTPGTPQMSQTPRPMGMQPNTSTNQGPVYTPPPGQLPPVMTNSMGGYGPVNPKTNQLSSPKLPAIQAMKGTGTSTQSDKPMTRINVANGTPDWLVPILQKSAEKHGIPVDVFSALAKHESAGTFNPVLKEYSGGNGRGIFQIDLGYHPITEEQAFDPNFAADYAAKLLKEGFDRTGSWDNALRYYNGGPGFASSRIGFDGKRSVDQITQNYANVVMRGLDNPVPVEVPAPKQLASRPTNIRNTSVKTLREGRGFNETPVRSSEGEKFDSGMGWVSGRTDDMLREADQRTNMQTPPLQVRIRLPKQMQKDVIFGEEQEYNPGKLV